MPNSREGAANRAECTFRTSEGNFETFLYATGSMQHAFATIGCAFATILKTNMVAGSLNILERSAFKANLYANNLVENL